MRCCSTCTSPTGPGPFPAAILVHGGGFDGGSRATNMAPTFQPLADAGFAWFSIDYRMAPEFRFPEAREDIDDRDQMGEGQRPHLQGRPGEDRAGRRIGRRLPGQLRGDPRNARDPRSPPSSISTVPSDYEKIARQRQAYPGRFNMASINGHQKTGGGIWFFGAEGYDEASFAKLKAISPLFAVHKGMPPFLAIHGTRDDQVPYEQSTMLCDAMHKVGARCDIITVEAGGHGMGGWKDADQQHYKAEMVAWLKKTLGGRT